MGQKAKISTLIIPPSPTHFWKNHNQNELLLKSLAVIYPHLNPQEFWNYTAFSVLEAWNINFTP
jgi:hypothetical protein